MCIRDRCACYARHLALSYVLAGVVNNPGSSCPDPRDWTVAALLYLISAAQRERGLAVAYLDPPSSSLSLICSRDSYLATREYFLVFHIVHPTFVLLSDHIFLRYYIMPCDNCVLVLLLLDCILPLCFRLWFLPVLILSVYTWGYFRPAYIRRSGVPVPAGAGRYRMSSGGLLGLKV